MKIIVCIVQSFNSPGEHQMGTKDRGSCMWLLLKLKVTSGYANYRDY